MYAITNQKRTIKINSINVWIDRVCNHPVTQTSINALLEEVKKSNMMTVTPNGAIDAFSDTPLFTNGQQLVNKLFFNNSLIWECKYR